MTRFILRLLIVPIGIGLAALTGFVVGLVGALGSGYGEDFVKVAGWVGVWILGAIMAGVDPDHVGTLLLTISIAALAILLAPICLVALAGELFAIRSWMLYVLGNGALFAAVPTLLHGGEGHDWPAKAWLGFAASGIAAGFVYWLIAGRGAAHKPPAVIASSDPFGSKARIESSN